MKIDLQPFHYLGRGCLELFFLSEGPSHNKEKWHDAPAFFIFRIVFFSQLLNKGGKAFFCILLELIFMAKNQDNIAAISHNIVAWKAVHFCRQ